MKCEATFYVVFRISITTAELLLFCCCCCCWCRRKYGGSSFTSRGYGNGAIKCSADLPQRRIPAIDHQKWNSGKLAVVNGNGSAYDDPMIVGTANEAGGSSDLESDIAGRTCCGLGVSGPCRSPGDEGGSGGRGVHVEFYRVPTERDRERHYTDQLPKLPQTPDSSGEFSLPDSCLTNAPGTREELGNRYSLNMYSNRAGEVKII